MALVVDGALFARRFREEEGAPVGDSSDDTTGGEDNVAGCFGDSGSGVRRIQERHGRVRHTL